MFDYEKFESDVLQQMETLLEKWTSENKDLYIFSLDCARGMESIGAIANTVHYLSEQTEPDSEEYWFYKYCETEWELFHTFEAISADMKQYLEENKAAFLDSETCAYAEAFDTHCEKIMECCTNVLMRLRQSLRAEHSDLLFTFEIREYLEEEEKLEIFEKINSKSAWKEYAAYIEEFM